MGDTITQTRLSMRLDRYLSDYTNKNVKNDTLFKTEWETAWLKVNAARSKNDLTPELVDDIRTLLNKL